MDALRFEMLYHGAASVPCSSCAKYVYDLETGKQEMYEAGEGNFLPILRNGPTPCSSCPKGGPENEEKLRLHWRNRMALDLYHRMRSTPRVRLPRHLRDCPVMQRNFHIIATTLKSARAEMKAMVIEKARQEAGNG